MIVIDRLCYSSKLRYTNAMIKFIYAVSTLVCCVASRSWLIAVIVLATNGILTVKKGGIPFRHYRRLMCIPLAFLLVSTLTILVNLSAQPMDAYAVPVGEWYLTGSRASVQMGIRLILTAFAALSCLFFLTLNTTMTDILGVMERLHVPAFLLELMLLIYRFVFVLLDTASRISTAQAARLGNRDFRTSMRSFGQMAAALFVRSLKKSDALYRAMEARGYDGRIRVLGEQYPPKRAQIACLVFYELMLFGIAIGERYI